MSLIRGRSARAILRTAATILVQAPRFVAGYLYRRDRRMWVFGNVHGFRDSPRYLAEYVAASQPDVTAVWIAHDPAAADAARAAGLEVAMANDASARKLQRRAGVAFFTHGFRDLDLPLVSGAYLVYLWHGTPLKRVGLDVSAVQSRRRPMAVRAAAGVIRWFHYRAYRLVDLFVAAGGLDRDRFMTAFKAPADRVQALGSPRFDVIRGGEAYERVVSGDLRAQLGYTSEHRLIVWLPTHRREYGDATWLPSLTSDQLDEALGADTDVRLLVKTHPNAEWDVYQDRLPGDPRIRLLRETHVDVNALLSIADGLISDYSSAFFDYSVTGRPIWFLAPDVDRYDADRGLYDPYDVVTGGRYHTEWPSLLRALRDFGQPDRDDEGKANAARVAEYTRNNIEPDSCRRIVGAILKATSG